VRRVSGSSDSLHACRDICFILDVNHHLTEHHHSGQEGLRMQAVGRHRSVGCFDHRIWEPRLLWEH
jgi:hypothetical protein